ncbi:MAG: flagellar motor switch phosphatase FliY [Oscillospiraceae bacterium]
MSNLSQAEIDALLNQEVPNKQSDADTGREDEADESKHLQQNPDSSAAVPGADASSGEGSEAQDFGKLDEELKMLDKSADYLTDEEKDILGEIGNICMGASATTMYTLLGHRVTITTPRVSVYTSGEVLSLYKSPFVIVKVEYRDGVDGKNLLILKEKDSILITDLLMGSESSSNTGAGLDEIHLSAMSEIMNQMIGSSATSLSNLLGVPIDITPPEAIWVGSETDVSPFIDGSQLAIKVSFDMEIEGVLKSELMQIMSIESGKQLAKALTGPHDAVVPEVRQAEKKIDISAAVRAGGDIQAPMRRKTNEQAEKARTVNVTPMKFEPFEEEKIGSEDQAQGAAMELIGDIPLQVAVELGKTRKSINDILNMGVGSVIVLDKMAGELVEVMVNGKRIARGEVVVIDENYGVRITDIVTRGESA